MGELLPNAYNPETIPEVGELDELETFVGFKKAARPRVGVRRKGMLAKTTKFGIGSAVDHFQQGIKGLGQRKTIVRKPSNHYGTSYPGGTVIFMLLMVIQFILVLSLMETKLSAKHT